MTCEARGRVVVVAANSAWNLVNFRAGLIRALQAEGHRVVALAPEDEHGPRLAELGVEFQPITMQNSGISPFADLLLLTRYFRALRKIGPDLFLGFTIKPNIYGSLAARTLGIRVINNISGLGTAFIRKGLLTRTVTILYRLALRGSSTVFFQNREDLDLFVRDKMARPDQARLIPGSGVDLMRFKPAAAGAANGEEFRFLLIARLLWDKGVQEFVDAARTIKAVDPRLRCQILGFVDVDNRTAVPRATLERWVKEGWIDYLGETNDVRPMIDQADCVVLPSYREGMPRALLEAAAMGKPVVATDVPGVREAVDDGATGFLCKARSARSLADAMLRMARLTPAERAMLGAAGRRKVECKFSQSIVIEQYLAAMAGKIS
jgi:glycosyltransferase involved in cell wall biosynthesis